MHWLPSVLSKSMERLDTSTRSGDREGGAGPSEPSLRFELVGDASDDAAIEVIEKAATEAAAAGGLGDEEVHFLGVAIREAVVNALRHGRGKNGCCSASVRVSVSPRGVLVATVKDRGPGFDPCTVPDPLAAPNLERGSGRGLLFMRRFADRVFFSFPRNGGAVVRLEKDLKRP